MAGVKRERNGAVGILTLDDPATLNAMTPQLLGDLGRAIAETTADPDVRCLVLTGAGRGFCSGQNLKAGDVFPEGVVDGGVWEHFYQTTPLDTIGGGTSEVQKNIIARRGLGLPLK